MKLSLNARSPFDFRNTVHSHGWYQLAPFTWDEAAQALERIEQLGSGRVVRLRFESTPGGVCVGTGGRLSAREQAEVAAKAAWMFALDADLSGFYDQADREPRLRHCRAHAHGRLLRSTTLWEDLVKVMLTTNIQWSGTRRLARALVEHYGAPLAEEPALRAFPGPERIARSRETTLRRLGLGYRAPYLLQLARHVASGAVDLDALKDPALETGAVRRRLIALPGIGPYAANTLLMLLERYDYIGVDTEAISAVSEHFFGGRPVGEKEIDATFAAWGRFKALAYWFWDYDGMGEAPMDHYNARPGH